MSYRENPDLCPVCGAEVSPDALACPGCGADHETGWHEDYNSFISTPDIPGDDFDYEEFVKDEFDTSPLPRGVKPIWWITAIIVIAAMIALYVGLVN